LREPVLPGDHHHNAWQAKASPSARPLARPLRSQAGVKLSTHARARRVPRSGRASDGDTSVVMASERVLSAMRSGEDATATRTRRRSKRPNSDGAVVGFACDVCGAALTRVERHRIVWDSGLGGGVVLADLCRPCAADGDQLLAKYGGHGRGAMRVTQPGAAPETGVAQRVSGVVIRGVLYALIALAVFFLVTFVTSRG